MQVGEDGESKCSAVMAEIEAYALLRKWAEFHLVLDYVKLVMKSLIVKSNYEY